MGCREVSEGCRNCYARTLHNRLMKMSAAQKGKNCSDKYALPFHTVRTFDYTLDTPRRWKQGRRVFVNSMSDLFHGDIPQEFVHKIFDTMDETPQHAYQILTKRPERIAQVLDSRRIPAHISIGTSVEDFITAEKRIPHLLGFQQNADWEGTSFLSVEPLINRIPEIGALFDVPGATPGWVIVGGESGRGARPMEIEWAVEIVNACRDWKVPVFVKQLGTVRGGRSHKNFDTFPPELQVREYPAGM